MEDFKIAAAYIRVSTDDQVEYSPASQLEKIKEYAKRNGYVLPDEFIFRDEGISGRNTSKRPEFNRMIGIAKQKPKPFDTILLWKFSRFARNREDSIVYKSMLRKQCGIDVISVSENVGDDKMSVLIEALIEAMDEYYSINLSEEVKRGLQEKINRGEPVVCPPIGYKLINGEAFPNPETAPIVQRIFGEYSNGKSAAKIAADLNAEGVRTKNGKSFTTKTVGYILRNSFYIGKLSWDTFEDVQGKHEPIISMDCWNKVQNKLKSSSFKKYRRDGYKKHTFMLQGLVRCNNCGSTLCFTQSYSGNPTIQCSGYTAHSCNISHSITIEKINKRFLDGLEQAAILEDFKIELRPIDSSAADEERRRIKLQIDRERNKLKRAKEAYENEVYTLDEYKETQTTVKAKIKELEEKLNSHQPEEMATSRLKGTVLEALPALRSSALSEEEKNSILKSFISKVIFHKPSGDLDIFFYI